MARVVQFEQYGGPDVLKIVDIDREEPGPNEVEIEVHAIGLNRAEGMFRAGEYLEKATFPSTLGYEASGLITKVGRQVNEFEIGESVSLVPPESISEWGTYRDYAVLPAGNLVKNPTGLTHIEAASTWMQYLTAWGGIIKYGQLGPRQYVLITASSSSVGIAAIQLARYIGAIPIAVTRTTEKYEALKKAGAELVLALDQDSIGSFCDKHDLTGRIDLVFDAVGGKQLNDLCKVLRYEGKIVLYGALSKEHAEFSMLTALNKCFELKAFVLHEFTRNTYELNIAKGHILDGLKSKQLTPVIDKVFNLNEVIDAHRYMEAGAQFGKIILQT